MKNKEERKYIREALRLCKLKVDHDHICMINIIKILKLADDKIKNLEL